MPVRVSVGEESAMAGEFEIIMDESGKYRLRVEAASGEIIASSQGYETKAGAENGIESVQANAPGADAPAARDMPAAAVVPQTLAAEQSCCADYLANSLDIHFLLKRRANRPPGDADIWPENARLDDMPIRSGAEVADELAGRMRLRYVEEQHPLSALGRRVWLTPTPLGVAGAAVILHLPNQVAQRHWVLVIDPAQVTEIQGPRRITSGQGIEYYLPHGYPDGALQEPGYGVRVR
jgi:uncharacterized protein